MSDQNGIEVRRRYLYRGWRGYERDEDIEGRASLICEDDKVVGVLKSKVTDIAIEVHPVYNKYAQWRADVEFYLWRMLELENHDQVEHVERKPFFTTYDVATCYLLVKGLATNEFRGEFEDEVVSEVFRKCLLAEPGGLHALSRVHRSSAEWHAVNGWYGLPCDHCGHRGCTLDGDVDLLQKDCSKCHAVTSQNKTEYIKEALRAVRMPRRDLS